VIAVAGLVERGRGERALRPREKSGAEGSRTPELLNAVRFEGVATVRDDARPCAIPTAPLLPRMWSWTVAHRRTATEPPQVLELLVPRVCARSLGY
jgi:hypothetical protein